MRPNPKIMYSLMNRPKPDISSADFTNPAQMMHFLVVPYALKFLHFTGNRIPELKISFPMIKPVSHIVASTPVH